MARCNDCNKFVSYDQGEPEVNSVEVDEGGIVTAEVRIVLNCADCGGELKSADLNMECDIGLSEEWTDGIGCLKDGYTLEVDDGDAEFTERSDGKPNTPSRYRRTFYGVILRTQVRCLNEDGKQVGDPVDVELTDEVQASGMDEAY